ncbi:MAG: PKD domain-containing protein [Methylococcaceae bacterium]|nr:PKD domain-containing protein [Methylococcaceae bacterium]
MTAFARISHRLNGFPAALFMSLVLMFSVASFPIPVLADAVFAGQLTLSKYQLVGKKRIDAQQFEYAYRGYLSNRSGLTLSGASAEIVTPPAGVTSTDGKLSFPTAVPGAIVKSQNVFHVRVGSKVRFDPKTLVWRFQGPSFKLVDPKVSVLEWQRISTVKLKAGWSESAYKAKVKNLSATEILSLTLRAVSLSRTFSLTDDNLSFTKIAPGGDALSDDTLLVRYRPSSRFKPENLLLSFVWNYRPVANAGPDQTVALGSLAQLDGSSSTDLDGDLLSFRWAWTSKPPGSSAQLSSTTLFNPTFPVDRPGEYRLSLTVNDGKADSAPDEVVVTTRNSPPVANAGHDQTVAIGSSALLDGTASSDVDGNPLTYRWRMVQAPVGSTATLAGNTTAQASFIPDKPGRYVIELIVNDGQIDSQPMQVIVSTANSKPLANAGPNRNVTVGDAVQLDGRLSSDVDGDPLSYLWSFTALPTDSKALIADPKSAQTQFTADLPGDYLVQLKVNDGKLDSEPGTARISAAPKSNPLNLVGLDKNAALGAIAAAQLTVGAVGFEHSASIPAGQIIRQNLNGANPGSSVDLTISLGPDNGLPPDPAVVAAAIDPTVATTIHAATQFLYTGANPVQTGVAAGTIEPKRAAVIRGKTLDKANNPLAGVIVTILNHPEFGQTSSRTDGQFDLAVNGGGLLTLNYQKTGFLPAQRQVTASWQDYAQASDLVMIPLDAQVTAIDLSSKAPLQVARGSTQTDKDGSRRATLLFPSGSTASMTMADGSTAPLSTFHVRTTEYTVGDNGPQTMPARLPATSGYTYAVEFSVDEAQAAGATGVTFSQSVISYNENFLNFPVGASVPVGYYDRNKGQWIPQTSGRIVKIAAINSGIADLIINATTTATDSELAALGVTQEERQQLATLYPVGQTLWRVPLSHFSPGDMNWPLRVPAGARGPSQPRPSNNGDGPDNPCTQPGCIIGIEGQTLSEEQGVTGTPYFLRYDSDRQLGRVARNTLSIPLIGADLPKPLKRIDLTVRIAGQLHQFSFPAQINQSTTFTWDGKDAYGRILQGQQPAFIDLGYVYNATYEETAAFAESGNGVQLSGDEARNEVTLHQTHTVTLGNYDARKEGLGGWTLSAHHRYDPQGKVLHQGDGQRRSVEGVSNIMTRAVTTDYGDVSYGVAVGADGSIYYADRARIYKVDSSGKRSVIAGNGTSGYSGDGGPAVNAQISPCAQHLSVAGDGSIVFFEGNCFGLNRIRRIDPAGLITTLVGNGKGSGGYVALPPEGVPGAEFSITDAAPRPAPDGSVYFSDSKHIFRVGTDGRVREVHMDFSGADAGPYDNFFVIADIAVGTDGSLYIMDTHFVLGNHLIRKLTPDGKVHLLAGTNAAGSNGDGGPALAAAISPSSNGGIAVSPSGDVYFSEVTAIRKISSDGIITLFAGNRVYDHTGDGGPATQASVGGAGALSWGPDQALYIADGHIRRVGPPLPGFDANSLSIPSEDGGELFVFDSTGKHLRTLNTLTGATMISFAYDSAGRLLTLTDGDNNVTTVERDALGNPTGIVSPYNQRTKLTADANGYFGTIANPAGEASSFGYSPTGLMLSKKDPANKPTTFAYDTLGRLVSDKDALGAAQTLTRSGPDNQYTVQHQSGQGRTSSYQVQTPSSGGLARVYIAPDGSQSQSSEGADGVNLSTDPDGSTLKETLGADPRWKMQSPISQNLTATSGGLTATLAHQRSVGLSDPGNPLSLTKLTDTVTLNDRSSKSLYDASSKTFTVTSPANRQSTAQIDVQGRLLQAQTNGLLAANLGYDSHGRLSSIAQGTDAAQRQVQLSYNPQGYLDTVTDAIGRKASYQYDAAGRITTQTLTDGRVIQYAYDADGNLTLLTPPGRPAHGFVYDKVNLNSEYDPPNVGAGSNSTLYSYDLDRQLTKITRPDGQTLNFLYDSAGRLSRLQTPLGDYVESYDAATGKLTQVTAPDGGTLVYAYNGGLLQSVSQTGTVAGKVGFGYDNDFRVTSISLNDADPIAYQYDADSLLIQAGTLNLSRDAQNGLLTGTALNNVIDSRSYDGFGEVTQYIAKYNGAALYSSQYTYDKLGRITQKQEILGGATDVYEYGYDLAGRLISVKKNGTSQSTYDYDTNGNRIKMNGVTIGTYDDQDRLTQYGAATYGYTANGELASKTAGSNSATYQYDLLGNLRQVKFAGTQIDYLIDAADRRVGKKLNGVLTQAFLYQSDLKPIAELDGRNNVVSRFVYATHANVPDYLVKAGVTYRIFTDHLGSPRLVVNTADGSVIQRMDYDEWGKVLNDTNPGFQPFGFAGGLYDRDTGLVRFGARDYDPETGRWTAKDPILFEGGQSNLYGYVLDDPMNSIDSTGDKVLKCGISCNVGPSPAGPVIKKRNTCPSKGSKKQYGPPTPPYYDFKFPWGTQRAYYPHVPRYNDGTPNPYYQGFKPTGQNPKPYKVTQTGEWKFSTKFKIVEITQTPNGFDAQIKGKVENSLGEFGIESPKWSLSQ